MAMTGAVPSTSLSSDHACFRQRVGPGQAGDSTTRRGWVIAAWVLDGRAGWSGDESELRGRAGVISGTVCRVVPMRRPGVPCQPFLPQSTWLKRVCRPGTVGRWRRFGVSSARRPHTVVGTRLDVVHRARPSRLGRSVAATLSTPRRPMQHYPQICRVRLIWSADPQCSERGGLLARYRIAGGADYRSGSA
jgi:hypothetical protein